MVKRRKIIVGAWKAFLNQATAKKLADELKKWKANDSKKQDDYDIVLSPSFPYLVPVQDAIKETNIALCAQDVDAVKMGPYTGHIPPPILVDVGCKYVLLGHSELRHLKEYSPRRIHEKVTAALGADLHVILCIGETKDEKVADKTKSVLKEQLETALVNLDEKIIRGKFDVAYEPVWAISSQNPDKPPKAEDVNNIHGFIREILNKKLDKKTADTVRILYGGSVNEDNVCDYLNQPNVDGVLVGSASTKHPQFVNLLNAVEERVLIPAQ